MNRCFRAPVVATQPGGAQAAARRLTPFGLELIETYRAIGSASGGGGRAAIAGAEKFIAPSPRALAKTAQVVDPGGHRALIALPR